MIKVVIDTNVVVSGNLVDERPIRRNLDLAANQGRYLRFAEIEFEARPAVHNL